MAHETVGYAPKSIRIEGYSPIQTTRLYQLHRAWMVYNTISDRLNTHPEEKRALGYEPPEGGRAYHPIDRQYHFGVWNVLWGKSDNGLVKACVDMGLREEVEDILTHYGKSRQTT